MVVNRISGVGRPLSLKYPTNRAIIIIVASVFILGTLVKMVMGDSFVVSIVWAFGAAASIFFAWAIARELDPDSNASAFVSATLVLAALFFAYMPALLTLFWFLLVMRILNRITGIAPKPLDLAIVIILAVVLSWQELWLYCLMTGLMLYINSWIDSEKKKGIVLFVIVLSLGIVSAFLGNAFLTTIEIPTDAIIVVALFTLLFIPVICTRTKLKSLTDITEEPVSVFRLRVTRIAAVVVGILVTILQGSSGFNDLLPLWTSIGGIIIWNIYKFIRYHKKT
ncbi:hypothetical protein ACFLS8_01650 [Chloroflexota bacterium]